MSDAASVSESGTPRRAPASWWVVLTAAVVAVAIVVGALLLVGPSPKPADSGLPKSPPPLALPDDVAETSPLARAAANLAADQLKQARAGFVDVVAEDPASEAGQVGLVLSRWRATGPRSVERDLRQLVAEYPESALVALHLGMVQSLLGEDRTARTQLRAARELGLDAADPTSLRMATLADDLMHPDAFRGVMPVLVQAREVREADRPSLAALTDAVGRGDVRAAARHAKQLSASPDPFARLAAAAATYDKADPRATVERMSQLETANMASASVRDRAVLLGALADLWSGGDRAPGCQRLARTIGPDADARTRRLAEPIHAELCAST